MIKKKPTNQTNLRKDLYFFNSAREGWYNVLTNLNSTYKKVLLPSYIGITEKEGSGIFDPVVRAGYEFEFYELNDDLSLNSDSTLAKIRSDKFDLILIVHYFGIYQKGIDQVINECKKRNLLVVEDCAHFMNFDFLGDTTRINGDLAFYSLHKLFPIIEGGALIIKQHTLESFFNNKPFDSSYVQNEFVCYDIDRIKDLRRDNYVQYEKLLRENEHIKPLRPLESQDIPHNFPVLIKNGLREKLYFWLIERNIHVISLYYRLIAPIKDGDFHTMNEISASILNLPVHQDTTKEDIIFLIEKINEFYAEETTRINQSGSLLETKFHE